MTNQLKSTESDQPSDNTSSSEKVEYLNDQTRSAEVTLKHPFRMAGVEYRKVTVRRLTGHEAKVHVQACVAMTEGSAPEPPFPGIELSPEAYAALDDDDIFQIDKAIDDFFPERFRVLGDLANRLEESPNSEPGAK